MEMKGLIKVSFQIGLIMYLFLCQGCIYEKHEKS